MKKEDFVLRAIYFAHALHFRVDTVTRGDARGTSRIWFNEKSRKFLHQLHLEALYPVMRKRGLSTTELNAAIEAVAPGRPCTHCGMREIYARIHAED